MGYGTHIGHYRAFVFAPPAEPSQNAPLKDGSTRICLPLQMGPNMRHGHPCIVHV